jgi:hypothetical protein
MKVSFGSDPNFNPSDKLLEERIDSAMLKRIMHHKRIEETVDKIRSDMTSKIEKNNEIRAKEQAKEASQKAKTLFSKRESGYVDGTKAVFMDSLDDNPITKERQPISQKDLVKLNKSLRNQQNRMANKASKEKENAAELAALDPFKAAKSATDTGRFQYPEDEDDFVDNDRDRNDPSMMQYRPLDKRFPVAAKPAKAAPVSRGYGGGSGNAAGVVSTIRSRSTGIGLKIPSVGGNNNSSSNSRTSRSNSAPSGSSGGSGGGIGRGGRPPAAGAGAGARAAPRSGGGGGGGGGGGAASAVAAPMVVADLAEASKAGKEWQKTGVHPSWAAKQHAKQQSVGPIASVSSGGGGRGGAGAGGPVVPTLGKKIIFDD